MRVCVFCRRCCQLHKPEYAAKVAAYKQHVHEDLSKMQAKGIAMLVIHHIIVAFKDKLRREHDWLGVAIPTLDAQVQRIEWLLLLCPDPLRDTPPGSP